MGRRKLLFLLIVLLVPATAVAISLSQPRTYSASAEVLLTSETPEGSIAPAYVDPQRVAQTRAKLARIPPVVDRVLEQVPSAGLDRKEFLESSTVSTTLGVDLLTFSVESSDPELATELATAYAQAFTSHQQELDDNVSAEVVNPATEAPRVGPRTMRNGFLAFGLGLVLALVVVFVVDALDTKVRSVDTIREVLGLRLLGRLATPSSRLRKGNGLVMLADPKSPDAEQFRALRASIDLANAEPRARTIMVTSAVAGEGKSTTVANLAVAFARAGHRVAVIDADLGDPHLHELFDLDPSPGLTDVEMEETWLVEAFRPINLTEDGSGADEAGRRTEHGGSLELLPAGSPVQDPDELGFERGVGRIIQRMRGRADIVLVDAPPLLGTHAIALSAHVDAVLLVVRLKALRTAALRDLSWILEASPAAKLGFILTGVDRSESYDQNQRYAASHRRRNVRARPTITTSPSDSNGRGEEAPGTAAQETMTSPARPFGGLTPREAGLRSAESRRAKTAQPSETGEHTGVDEAQDEREDP